MEIYNNLAQSDLDGGINDSVTTITVLDGSVFPNPAAGEQFRVNIEDEILIVTGISTNDLTVIRGQEGTAAASHLTGVPVTHVLTAGALDQIRKDLVASNTYANIPSIHKEGNLFLPSNAPYLFRNNGSAYIPHGPLHRLKLPVDGDFSWLNEGTTTKVTSNGAVTLHQFTGVNEGISARIKSAPSTPYYFTAGFHWWGAGANCVTGVLLRDSSTSKIIVFNFNLLDALGVGKYTNHTTFNSTYLTQTFRGNNSFIFFKIEDNGTNLIFSFSYDNNTFLPYFTVSNTDFMTVNQIGFFIGSFNTDGKIAINLLHWEEG